MNKELSKIIIGTGSYDNVKNGNTVSITGDGGNAWGYYGNAYKKLAPKLVTYIPYAERYEQLQKMKQQYLCTKEYLEFRKKIEDEYIESYYKIRLENLNVDELLRELENRFDDKIILLCHEPIEEFCHRRIAADFIELQTGLYIPEVSTDKSGNIKELNPISYKRKLMKLMNKR